MIAFKRILVPHDFSDTSHAAVNYGIALARAFGARLHFLYVSDRAQLQLETEFPLGLDGAVQDAVRERRSSRRASRPSSSPSLQSVPDRPRARSSDTRQTTISTSS